MQNYVRADIGKQKDRSKLAELYKANMKSFTLVTTLMIYLSFYHHSAGSVNLFLTY